MKKLIIMGWRNVWRNQRRTIIAVIAIALGLALMLFFDGLMGGAKEAIYGNTVKLQGGNVQVHAPGYGEKAKQNPLLPLAAPDAVLQACLAQPHVVAASQRIKTGGMVSSREGTFPVAIVGIQPQREAPVSLIAEKTRQGRYLQPGDQDVILIGQALAKKLEVQVGDRVTLVGRATHEQMRRRTMAVVGIYSLGIKDVEEGMVYVSLSEAQVLFGLNDSATEVAVFLERIGQEDAVVQGLRAALPGYEVDAWDALNPEIKDTMEMEDQIMAIFGLIILIIAGVGILNLMLMAVFERTREIGLLAAMGLKRREIVALFLTEGVLIGVLGALVGGGLGILVNLYFGQVGLDWSQATEYSELAALLGGRIYFRVSMNTLVDRALTVAIIAGVAALYPAWKASRQEPAEALHFV
jgi:ABC-type lipoprotein release transport system permease subunit